MERRRRSDYVPEEIQRDIMLRLPVKSLVRFRSVNKRLRCLLSTQQFITDHLKTFRCEEDKLILLGRWCSKQLTSCLFLDGLIPTHIQDIRLSYETTNHSYIRMVRYCDGIVCLIFHDSTRSTCELLFMNPSIQKVVAIPASDCLIRNVLSPVFGFGYAEDDYKLVVFPSNSKKGASVKANVFSLKTRNWKTVVCSWSRPQDLKYQHWKIKSKRPVFVDGALHWLAKEFNFGGGSTNFVLKFSLGGDHKIGKIALPRIFCSKIHVYDGRLSVIVRDELWVLNKCGFTWSTIMNKCDSTWGSGKILGFSGGGGVVLSQTNELNGCTCEELTCYNPRTDTMLLLKKNNEHEDISPDRLYTYRQSLALLD